MDTAEQDLIGFRQAESEYGIPRHLLRGLPYVAGPRRSKLVRRADVEQLVGGSGRCEKCGRKLKPGQTLCQQCRAEATNARIWTEERRDAAVSRGKDRFPPGDHPRRRRIGEKTLAAAKRRAARYDELEGLTPSDVAQRLSIATKYVVELARKHDIGQVVIGYGGHAGKRRRFTEGDVEKLRALLRTRIERLFECIDCGRRVYNRVRCTACHAALEQHPWAKARSEMQDEAKASVQAAKRPGELTVSETVSELGLPRPTVHGRASERGLGRIVTDALGRPHLLLSKQDRAQLVPVDAMKRARFLAVVRHDTREIGALAAERRRKADYEQIRGLRTAGKSLRAIAAETGASLGSVRNALKGTR